MSKSYTRLHSQLFWWTLGRSCRHSAVFFRSRAEPQLCALEGHKLSVVQLAFSPDDRWLVSASRDRQWSLYERTSDAKQPYRHVLTQANAHERIIWCVWTDLSDWQRIVTLLKLIYFDGLVLPVACLPVFSRSVDWAPDSSFFLTGSRDHSVKLWPGQQQENSGAFSKQCVVARMTAGVTAVCLAPR